MNGFSEKRIASKVDLLKERKIYCLRACPCIFQHGNFTGWGSECVNQDNSVRGCLGQTRVSLPEQLISDHITLFCDGDQSMD